MQCQILCLEKLSSVRGNLPNVNLVRHANTEELGDNEIQKQRGWLRMKKIDKDCKWLQSNNLIKLQTQKVTMIKEGRWMTKTGEDYKWLQNISSVR